MWLNMRKVHLCAYVLDGRMGVFESFSPKHIAWIKTLRVLFSCLHIYVYIHVFFQGMVHQNVFSPHSHQSQREKPQWCMGPLMMYGALWGFGPLETDETNLGRRWARAPFLGLVHLHLGSYSFPQASCTLAQASCSLQSLLHPRQALCTITGPYEASPASCALAGPHALLSMCVHPCWALCTLARSRAPSPLWVSCNLFLACSLTFALLQLQFTRKCWLFQMINRTKETDAKLLLLPGGVFLSHTSRVRIKDSRMCCLDS